MTPLLAGFLVPSLFLFVGLFGKKLIEPEWQSWEWADWYLGIEFTLAAITACALNGCDLYKSGKRIEEKIATLSHDETVSAEKKQTIAHAYAKEQTEISSEKDRNIICLALSFIAFLYVGTVHKKWAVGEDGWKKKAKLGIEANVYGYVASVVYLLWVKGIW